LSKWDGACDVVTAIEVIEHIEWPVEALTRMRRLLKPGGVLFLTTGNARPQRQRILDWRYATPEMHISFFEPQTLATAMKLAGFVPEFRGFMPGFAEIIRYKILKNLGRREVAVTERLLPWSLLSRAADWFHRVTAHPIGWASAVPSR
jgi:ubiquinone/menaquinone biosynthesis C-methylase UbiE